MKIWDITMLLDEQAAEWPGDTPFSFGLSVTKEQSGSVNIGEMTLSMHMGTHIDAPFHYDDEGMKVEQLPLDAYMGTAAVIDVTGHTHISPDLLQQSAQPEVTAVLLKTGSWPDRTVFPSSYPVFDEAIADWMANNGIRLLGVDTPSVDPETSKELPMHQAMNRSGRLILEGIVLDEVPEGLYQFAALPLKVKGADGSPVRAVLYRA